MKQNLTYLVDRFCKLTILLHTRIGWHAVKLHSRTFSFHKVVRQQIWGEVVDFITGFLQFIWECSSERIIKIGQHLSEKWWKYEADVFFMKHSVYGWHWQWWCDNSILLSLDVKFIFFFNFSWIWTTAAEVFVKSCDLYVSQPSTSQ